MIAIVDYGMGNLRSVQKGFERVGAAAAIVTNAEQIRAADKLVLPGVGAFGDAMVQLNRRGLTGAVREAAQSGRPFLGICLGLQLLFEASDEEGEHAGLSVLGGGVVRFDFSNLPGGRDLKVPHMGWNEVFWERPCPLMAGLNPGTYFYFVHSYHVRPRDAELCAGTCRYGYDFTAVVRKDNLYATQFHPEKSQQAGLTILKNFAAL